MAENFPKSRKHYGEKGEISRYDQFLPFPQYFQKSCIART